MTDQLISYFSTSPLSDRQSAKNFSEVYGVKVATILNRVSALRRAGKLPKRNTNRRTMRGITL